MRIATAALLCIPFTIISFQPARDDGYDSEKMGLIILLAAIIVGAQGITLLRKLRGITVDPQKHLLHVGVVALFGLSVISTSVSLSPSLSFWGEPGRSQGLLTAAIYTVLFLQATQWRNSDHSRLIITLLVAGIPVCIWQIYLFTQGNNRLLLGSSAGNPNFLSSWIVMVLLFCAPQIYGWVHSWLGAFTRQRWILMFLYATPITLLILSLIINASRGALFGLVVGVLFLIVALASADNKKWLLKIIPAVLIVGFAGYMTISLWIKANPDKASLLNGDQLIRLFVPYDPVRLNVWQSAAMVVQLQGQPVFTINRQPDTLALWRPLIGYGPETIQQLQSRFGDIFGSNVAVNSFHNGIFDVMITQGWLGLLAWAGLMETALYVGLRRLGLIPPNSFGQWSVWQVSSGGLGWAALCLVASPAEPMALAPVGISLGALAGILILIGKQGFRSDNNQTKDQLWHRADTIRVIAILAVLVAQWVDNLFGFAQASTSPLFWILLGILASAVANKSTVEPNGATFAPEPWIQAVLIAGLFTIQSLGMALDSQSFSQDTGTAQIPMLLAALLAFGLTMTILHFNRNRRFVLRLAIIPLIWSGFYVLKAALIHTSGVRLDELIATAKLDTLSADLAGAMLLSSVTGLLLIIVGVIAQFASANESGNKSILLRITICLMLAYSLYATQYASGILHSIGNAAAQNARSGQVPQSPELAIAALKAANNLVPSDAPLRLHLVSALATSLSFPMTDDDQKDRRRQIREHLNELFRQEPYFVNTLEWRNFSAAYASLFQSK